MNNLIIIGNGFDLAHGLKTSYKDFILWYLSDVIDKYKNEYKFSDQCYSLRYNPIGTHSNISISEIQDFRKYIDMNRISLESKFSFVDKLLEEISLSNWVDIEYEYFRTLSAIIKDFNEDSSKDFATHIAQVRNLNESISFLEQKLCEYLQNVIQTTSKSSHIAHHFRRIISDSKKNSEKNLPSETCLVNFNYTNTLNFYQVELSGVQQLIHIHGKIAPSSHSIIFGYGDEMDPIYPSLEQLNENEVLKKIKSFHYSNNSNYRNLIRFADATEYKIYVMGHSCGLSDRVLLNCLFEHDNCREIQIYYHQREDGTTDFFEKTQEISRHFRPENKAKMRNKIVPFDKCEPLVRPS